MSVSGPGGAGILAAVRDGRWVCGAVEDGPATVRARRQSAVVKIVKDADQLVGVRVVVAMNSEPAPPDREGLAVRGAG